MILERTGTKIFSVVSPHDAGYTNMAFLYSLPIGVMPKVFHILQGNGLRMARSFNVLDGVFRFMREWSMPLLYTSRAGPELRRSERIRKRMVKQLMGK